MKIQLFFVLIKNKMKIRIAQKCFWKSTRCALAGYTTPFTVFINDMLLVIGKAQLKSKYQNQPEIVINGLFDFEYSELIVRFWLQNWKMVKDPKECFRIILNSRTSNGQEYSPRSKS